MPQDKKFSFESKGKSTIVFKSSRNNKNSSFRYNSPAKTNNKKNVIKLTSNQLKIWYKCIEYNSVKENIIDLVKNEFGLCLNSLPQLYSKYELSPKHYLNSWSLLHLCVATHNHKLLIELLDHNVDINNKTKAGNTALMLACRFQNRKAIEILQKYNANYNLLNNNNRNILHECCSMYGVLSIDQIRYIDLNVPSKCSYLDEDDRAISYLCSSAFQKLIRQPKKYLTDHIKKIYDKKIILSYYKNFLSSDKILIHSKMNIDDEKVISMIQHKDKFEATPLYLSALYFRRSDFIYFIKILKSKLSTISFEAICNLIQPALMQTFFNDHRKKYFIEHLDGCSKDCIKHVYELYPTYKSNDNKVKNKKGSNNNKDSDKKANTGEQKNSGSTNNTDRQAYTIEEYDEDEGEFYVFESDYMDSDNYDISTDSNDLFEHQLDNSADEYSNDSNDSFEYQLDNSADEYSNSSVYDQNSSSSSSSSSSTTTSNMDSMYERSNTCSCAHDLDPYNACERLQDNGGWNKKLDTFDFQKYEKYPNKAKNDYDTCLIYMIYYNIMSFKLNTADGFQRDMYDMGKAIVERSNNDFQINLLSKIHPLYHIGNYDLNEETKPIFSTMIYEIVTTKYSSDQMKRNVLEQIDYCVLLCTVSLDYEMVKKKHFEKVFNLSRDVHQNSRFHVSQINLKYYNSKKYKKYNSYMNTMFTNTTSFNEFFNNLLYRSKMSTKNIQEILSYLGNYVFNHGMYDSYIAVIDNYVQFLFKNLSALLFQTNNVSNMNAVLDHLFNSLATLIIKCGIYQYKNKSNWYMFRDYISKCFKIFNPLQDALKLCLTNIHGKQFLNFVEPITDILRTLMLLQKLENMICNVKFDKKKTNIYFPTAKYKPGNKKEYEKRDISGKDIRNMLSKYKMKNTLYIIIRDNIINIGLLCDAKYWLEYLNDLDINLCDRKLAMPFHSCLDYIAEYCDDKSKDMSSFTLTVNRIKSVDDSKDWILRDYILYARLQLEHCKHILLANPDKLKVSYTNEIAEGYGPTREFLSQLANYIFKPRRINENSSQRSLLLFDWDPNHSSIHIPTFLFKNSKEGDMKSLKNDLLSYYEFAGTILAACIVQGIDLEIPLSLVLVKLLYNHKLNFNDLVYYDNDLYNSLKKFSTTKESIIKEADLDFTTTEICFNYGAWFYDGEYITHSQQANIIQHNKSVNKKNIMSFLKNLTLFKLLGRPKSFRNKCIKKFVTGFQSVIPVEKLKVFAPEHLKEYINNNSLNFNLEQFKKIVSTIYEKKNEIKWFWEIISEYDIEQIKLLFLFWTGSSTIPINKFENYTHYDKWLVEVGEEYKTSKLPYAHTCLNKLLLPKSHSKNDLKIRLDKALKYGTVGYDESVSN